MKPVYAFFMRCIGTGLFLANGILLGSIAVAGGSITTHNVELAVLTGIQGALGYAGIGAAVPQIEPKIGNKATTK
jgi:hypothetical protein